jgi:hypothetical protein
MLSENYKIPTAPPPQSLLRSRLMVFMPAPCAIAVGLRLGENTGGSMSQT